jgi:hypothetical protein
MMAEVGCSVAVTAGCSVLVGASVRVAVGAKVAFGASVGAGAATTLARALKITAARMTRMKVVIAAERNNVLFFIWVKYLLKLDPIHYSTRQNSHPQGAAFSLFRKRKRSKRVVPGELRTGIGHSYGLIILCAIYTVGEQAEKLRGGRRLLISDF